MNKANLFLVPETFTTYKITTKFHKYIIYKLLFFKNLLNHLQCADWLNDCCLSLDYLLIDHRSAMRLIVFDDTRLERKNGLITHQNSRCFFGFEIIF